MEEMRSVAVNEKRCEAQQLLETKHINGNPYLAGLSTAETPESSPRGPLLDGHD